MTLDNYHIKINEQKELEIQQESLVDVLKYYVLFSNITNLSFFEYDYELNNFVYGYSVDAQEKYILEDIPSISDTAYSVILEENNTIYGMLSFEEDPGDKEIISELFEKIMKVSRNIFSLQKQFLSQESAIDIFIVTDNKTRQFANKLEDSLRILLNANITIVSTAAMIKDQLKEKTKKSIIVYTIDNIELLTLDQEILETLNEFLFVIGPSDYNTSLFCGHLNVYRYLTKEDFVPEILKSHIIEIKNKVQNKYINKNKIIALSGISGGIGVTTIAMNMANILSKKNPDKNVLYIDLSTSKAISNLFLEQNPLPKKTIIDLVNSGEFDIEKNLENGLVKVQENFYAISGIQKHIDKDMISQNLFIEKLLEYISKMSEQFNFIIIDTGEANAETLNTTIYDISNELWIITEMSLPHISKLKTFFSLMKRAGLKDKLTFLVNRYDSVNAISVSDVTSIINTVNEDNLNFEFKIPNDYPVLGHCWNYCELASDTHPKSVFVHKLEDVLLSRGLFKQEKIETKQVPFWMKFFSKD